MWPFKRSRSKWMRGLLHAEQALQEAGEIGRRELDDLLETSRSFDHYYDEFDRGVRDYLYNWDQHERERLQAQVLTSTPLFLTLQAVGRVSRKGSPDGYECKFKFQNKMNFSRAPKPPSTLTDVWAWMVQARDELLYPVANGDTGDFSAIADGLGQHLPGLLEHLDALIAGTKQ